MKAESTVLRTAAVLVLCSLMGAATYASPGAGLQERRGRPEADLPAAARERRATLARAGEFVHRLKRRARAALDTPRLSAAIRRHEEALAYGRALRRHLQREQRRHRRDRITATALGHLLRRLDHELAEVNLHVASAYTVRGSYQRAHRYAAAALALDPESRAARRQRALIEAAAAEDGRYGRRRFLLPRGTVFGHGVVVRPRVVPHPGIGLRRF